MRQKASEMDLQLYKWERKTNWHVYVLWLGY